MKLIKKSSSNIIEARQLSSLGKLRELNARDIADGIFLHLVALHILKSEFLYAPVAIDYAQKTVRQSFDQYRPSNTDLNILLHVLAGKDKDRSRQMLANQKNNDILFATMRPNINEIKLLLVSYAKKVPSPTYERNLLQRLETYLHVTNSNYRSVRVLAANWDRLQSSDKKLAMTRLLQAFRNRYFQSDLRPFLEKLSRDDHLEIKGAHNPEGSSTGNVNTSNTQSHWSSALRNVAPIAGAVAGVLYGLQRFK